jgi:hypothetical protein
MTRSYYFQSFLLVVLLLVHKVSAWSLNNDGEGVFGLKCAASSVYENVPFEEVSSSIRPEKSIHSQAHNLLEVAVIATSFTPLAANAAGNMPLSSSYVTEVPFFGTAIALVLAAQPFLYYYKEREAADLLLLQQEDTFVVLQQENEDGDAAVVLQQAKENAKKANDEEAALVVAAEKKTMEVAATVVVVAEEEPVAVVAAIVETKVGKRAVTTLGKGAVATSVTGAVKKRVVGVTGAVGKRIVKVLVPWYGVKDDKE